MSRLVIVVENPSDWGAYYPSTHVVAARDYLREPPGQQRAHPRHQPVPQLQVPGQRLLRLAAGRGARTSRDPVGAHHQRAAPACAVRPGHRGPEPEAGAGAEGRRARQHRLRHPGVFRADRASAAAGPGAPGVRTVPLPAAAHRVPPRARPGRSARSGRSACTPWTMPRRTPSRRRWSTSPSKVWRKPRARRRYRYDIAMLVNPDEAMPPSNRGALKAFIAAGKQLDVEVDPIGPQRLRAPGRIRRPVHPRDHRHRPPHLPLRASRRAGGHGGDRRSGLDPALHQQDLPARPAGLAQAGRAGHRDPVPRRPGQTRCPARQAGLADRAEDSRRLVLARRGQGRDARGAQADGGRAVQRTARC